MWILGFILVLVLLQLFLFNKTTFIVSKTCFTIFYIWNKLLHPDITDTLIIISINIVHSDYTQGYLFFTVCENLEYTCKKFMRLHTYHDIRYNILYSATYKIFYLGV